MAAPRGGRRSILMCTMGTRGDVQPFVALGLHLTALGWDVTLAGPPECRAFVAGEHGLQFEDIGLSLQHAMNATPQGKALRTASAFTALQATTAFFRLPLLESWFGAARRLLLARRPDVLLLTSFVAMSGAAALPDILGLPTRVVLAHTIPLHPTGEFGMPLAGTGFTAPAAWLNRLQWGGLRAAVAQQFQLPRAQGLIDAAVAEASAGPRGSSCSAPGSAHSAAGSMLKAGVAAAAAAAAAADLEEATARLVGRTRLAQSLSASPVPTIYVWSSALLPKPADWPSNTHVVGPLLLRRHQTLARAAAAAPRPSGPPLPLPLSVPAPAVLHSELPAEAPERTSSGGSTASSLGAAPATPVRLDAAAVAAAASLDGASGPPSPVHPPTPRSAGSSVGGGSASSAAGAEAAIATECGLSPALQAYLDGAARRNLAVAYIGLGSMLGTVFEPPEVARLVGCMASAAASVAAQAPACAIIHAPFGLGGIPAAAAGPPPPALRGQPPFFLLSVPVRHELLLPQCELVVHHGGAGTTQAALLAGKPSLVIPCVPSSDQPFWADLVARRGLGPPCWFPVRHLTAPRLASGILAGLAGLPRYAAAAEALAAEMAREDGVAAAAAIIESCLLG